MAQRQHIVVQDREVLSRQWHVRERGRRGVHQFRRRPHNLPLLAVLSQRYMMTATLTLAGRQAVLPWDVAGLPGHRIPGASNRNHQYQHHHSHLIHILMVHTEQGSTLLYAHQHDLHRCNLRLQSRRRRVLQQFLGGGGMYDQNLSMYVRCARTPFTSNTITAAAAATFVHVWILPSTNPSSLGPNATP